MYIKGYAKYAAPLMDALKGKYQFEDRVMSEVNGSGRDGNNLPLKPKKRVRLSPKQSAIDWTDDMKAGFQGIKDALVCKVSLYLPRANARWRSVTDASDYAVGGALEQEQEDGNWHPVAFFSRKLQGDREGKRRKHPVQDR